MTPNHFMIKYCVEIIRFVNIFILLDNFFILYDTGYFITSLTADSSSLLGFLFSINDSYWKPSKHQINTGDYTILLTLQDELQQAFCFTKKLLTTT